MIDGFHHLSGFLNRPAQIAMVAAVRRVIKAAPLYHARMPRSGKELRVAQTNCGPLGWYSDEFKGYRYQPNYPGTEQPWPQFPTELLAQLVAIHNRLPAEMAGFVPEACLINWYTEGDALGLHKDADEPEWNAPIVMFSLGDDALFQIGGLSRDDPKSTIRVRSGDVCIMAGKARQAWHGVSGIVPGSSGRILGDSRGRFSLTVRQVNAHRIRSRRAV